MILRLENYKKMKQLDRIEYLLVKKENKFDFMIVEFVCKVAPLLLLMLIVLLLAFQIKHDTIFLTGVFTVISLIKIFFWIFLVVDVVSYIFYSMKKKQINEYLFKLTKGKFR